MTLEREFLMQSARRIVQLIMDQASFEKLNPALAVLENDIQNVRSSEENDNNAK